MLLGGPLGSWQALLMSPKGRNASRDGFVNLNISLNSIASFGSLAPVGLALLFCFSLVRRSLSIVTTWNQQYIYIYTGVGISYSSLPIFRLFNKNTMFSKITYHLFYQLTIHVSRQTQQISNKDLLVSYKCSKCRPPASTHRSHRLRTLLQTF